MSGKKILSSEVLRKKFLPKPNHLSPAPLKVKWSAPYTHVQTCLATNKGWWGNLRDNRLLIKTRESTFRNLQQPDL